jgi:cell division protein FtsL
MENNKSRSKFLLVGFIGFLSLALVVVGVLNWDNWNLSAIISSRSNERQDQNSDTNNLQVEDSEEGKENVVDGTIKSEIEARTKLDNVEMQVPVAESFLRELKKDSVKVQVEGQKVDTDGGDRSGEDDSTNNSAIDGSTTDGVYDDKIRFPKKTLRVRAKDGTEQNVALTGDYSANLSGANIVWYFGSARLEFEGSRYYHPLGLRTFKGHKMESGEIEMKAFTKIGNVHNVNYDLFGVKSYASSTTASLEIYYAESEVPTPEGTTTGAKRVYFVTDEGEKKGWVGDRATNEDVEIYKQEGEVLGIITSSYNNVHGIFNKTAWVYEKDSSNGEFVLTESANWTENI